MEIKFIDEMTDEELHNLRLENIEYTIKNIDREVIDVCMEQSDKIKHSKDELQKINKRHKRGKW